MKWGDFVSIYIKEAIKEDIKEIDNLLTDLIQDERQYDENINKDYIAKNYYEQFFGKNDSCIIVAKNENNNILGYGFGFIIDCGNVYDCKISQLDALYIKPEFRKKGIARQIIQYFTEWSKKNKVLYIELKVCNSNSKAINLYEKEGFLTDKKILKKKL